MSESEGYTNTRRSPRVEPPEEFVVLVESFGQFLEQHAKDVSEGGMFLRSAAPPPPGTRLRFAIRLADGFPLIQGEGEVVWRREQREGPFDPPGMGVRFLRLEEQGRELVRRLVEERRKTLGSPAEDSSGTGAGEPGQQPEAEARQALSELLDVLEAGSAGGATEVVGEEDPFGPLEAPEKEPEAAAAGADLFELDGGGEAEERPPEPGSGAEPAPVQSREPEPETPAPILETPQVDAPPAGASAPGDGGGETLPPVELPEIGRPAGYYDEEEPLPPARGRWFWPFAVPVALLALVALGYGAWQLGYLGWAGLPAPGAAGIAGRAPVETPTPAAPAPAEKPTAVAEAVPTAAPTPSPAPTEAPTAAPTPVPTRPPATARTAPAPQSPATVVRRVTWKAEGGGVEVRLAFDGAVQSSRVRVSRLDDPPRTLVRIQGIRRQYEPAEIGVGRGPLRRVRVWLHDELRPPQLWVVLDLETAGARVSRRIEGSELVLTVR